MDLLIFINFESFISNKMLDASLSANQKMFYCNTDILLNFYDYIPVYILSYKIISFIWTNFQHLIYHIIAEEVNFILMVISFSQLISFYFRHH